MKQVITPYDAILNIKKARDCHNNSKSCFTHKKCDECSYYIDSETLDLSLEVLEKYVAYHQAINNSNSGTISRKAVMSYLGNIQYSKVLEKYMEYQQAVNNSNSGTVSRHAVISHFENTQYSAELCQEYGIMTPKNMNITETLAMSLPLIQPEHPKGEWVEADMDSKYVTCSRCKEDNIKERMAYIPAYAATLNFCPTCGADMKQSSLLLRRTPPKRR